MSYYKVIDGKKYDKELLTKADHFQTGESFIDDNCTWQIIMHCEDGGKFTKIELDTLNYIFNNFNFSTTMREQFRIILFLCNSLTKEAPQ